MQQQFEHLQPEFIAVHDVGTDVVAQAARRHRRGQRARGAEAGDPPPGLRHAAGHARVRRAARRRRRVAAHLHHRGRCRHAVAPGPGARAAGLQPARRGDGRRPAARTRSKRPSSRCTTTSIAGPWHEPPPAAAAAGRRQHAGAARAPNSAAAPASNVRTTPQVDAPGRRLGLHQRHLEPPARARAAADAAPAPPAPSPRRRAARAVPRRRAAAPSAAASAAAAGDAADAGGAAPPSARPTRRRRTARALRAPAQRAHRHGQLLRLRAVQRPAPSRTPAPARGADELATHGAELLAVDRRHQPRAGPRPRDARSGHHARRAPPAAARRCRKHPGLALHAVLDKTHANLTLARLQVQRMDALFDEPPPSAEPPRAGRAPCRLSARRARSGTRRPRRRPGSRPSGRSGPRGSAWPPGSRCAAGSPASAAARRTPGRSRPWPARPAPRGDTSSFMSIFSSRASSTLSWIFAIASMFFASSAWNTTVSSMRFRNSGRKCCLTSTHTASRIDLAGLPGHLHDLVRAEVAGHHDHGVLEVHRAALAVGQAAVVEHLQQHVEHVRVRLLDLVEQQHAVGLAAHRLGQVAALVVADVARRRADQAARPSASP